MTRHEARRWALIGILAVAGAANVMFWYAWLVVGIFQGAMTTEAGPGRAW